MNYRLQANNAHRGISLFLRCGVCDDTQCHFFPWDDFARFVADVNELNTRVRKEKAREELEKKQGKLF